MKKLINNLMICATLLFVASGCNEPMTFKELMEYQSSDLSLKKYSNKKMNYSISLPKSLQLTDSQYSDSTSYQLFLDSKYEFMEGTNSFSIHKFHSLDTSLTEAWKTLTKDRQEVRDFKLFSSGITDYLSEPAYYEHSEMPISNKMQESMGFLVRGDSTEFYFFGVQANKENNHPQEFQELVHCIKTLQIKKNTLKD